MIPSRTYRYVRPWASLALLGSILALSASGQGLQGPLMMASVEQMTDEFGRVLQGHAQAPGDLVITYQTTDGVIHPPDVHGRPHGSNVEVPGGRSGMGSMTPRRFLEPGAFGLALTRTATNQPFIQDGKKIFVRVFNAPTVEEASFYTDSQVVVPDSGERFRLVFGASSTDQPLDPADDDGDGLHNSYEKSMGTDKYDRDSDADGMNDNQEFIAGTDGRDRDSLLQMNQILEASGNDIFLSWSSVSGKTYHVQANAYLSDTHGFTDIPNGEISATSGVTRIMVPDQFLNDFYTYRVIVRPDP